jgi:hypothetical protein
MTQGRGVRAARRGWMPRAGLAGLVVVCGADGVVGQAPGWVQVAGGPSQRRHHDMVYDSQRQVCRMFGGLVAYPAVCSNEVWEWNGAWVQRATTGIRPQPRWASAWAYDSIRDVCVMFGGYLPGVSAETWLYDAALDQWTLAVVAGPPGRRVHAMAFDAARGEVMLFGGLADRVQAPHLEYLADTWTWNGTSWTQRLPTHAPAERALHSMVYDSDRGRVVLFGGVRGPVHGDTWEWDGVDWEFRAGTGQGPPAGGANAIAYDSHRRVTVLVSGDAVWVWNGAHWFQSPLSGALFGCPARDSAAMTFFPPADQIITHGGADPTTAALFADTWALRIATHPASYTPFGAGCPGPNGLVPAVAGAAGVAPWLGSSTDLELTNLPVGSVSLHSWALGLSDTTTGSYALPYDLGPALPGCWQLVSIDETRLSASALGQAAITYVVPPSPAAVGFTFFVQVAVLYADTSIAVSNGLRAVVGY